MWVGTQDDEAGDCWVEVGDYKENIGSRRYPELSVRTYYWGENTPDGYSEHLIYIRHPGEGAYQEYTIDYADGHYQIYVGGYWEGTSDQPGKTLGVDVGLETSDPRSFAGPTYYQNFKFRPWDDTQWYPWDNRTRYADAPAYWQWRWPEAVNGIGSKP
jgi:hypothetical protein